MCFTGFCFCNILCIAPITRQYLTFSFVLLQAVNKLEAELKKSGQPFEVFRYPDVGHAFMNATPEVCLVPTSYASAATCSRFPTTHIFSSFFFAGN